MAAAAALLIGTGAAAIAAPAIPSDQSSQPANAGAMQSQASRQASEPHMGRKMADANNARASAESAATNALNALEAHGYMTFTNFHKQGNEFEATVTQNGKPVNVMIDPTKDSVVNAR
jgi:hypothetical protein